MKKILPGVCLLAACLLGFVFVYRGSTAGEETEAEYQIYYVNKEETSLVSVGYDAKAEETETLIEELLARMDENPGDAGIHSAKPDNVALNGYALVDAFLYMNFSQEYQTVDAVREVLYRAAVVETLTQIPGVEGVSFEIAGAPLADGRGNAVGMMTADSFVDNTGETINAFKRETLNLYFAGEEGNTLKMETVDVVYNGNVSQEKLILEQLIAGPQAEGYKATLPSDMKVLNIRVLDGTCYVNLDDKFQNLSPDITEDVAIYSVVDSLTELNTIQRVQFSINGKTEMVLRESRRLDQVYERKLDLVEE